jgi:hypothetical protein
MQIRRVAKNNARVSQNLIERTLIYFNLIYLFQCQNGIGQGMTIIRLIIKANLSYSI